MKTRKAPSGKPREVEIIHPFYQPSAAELREDLRLEGTFEGTIKALVQPAIVRYLLPKKRDCSGSEIPARLCLSKSKMSLYGSRDLAEDKTGLFRHP